MRPFIQDDTFLTNIDMTSEGYKRVKELHVCWENIARNTKGEVLQELDYEKYKNLVALHCAIEDRAAALNAIRPETFPL